MSNRKNYKTYDDRYIVGMTKLLFAIEYLGRYCSQCNFDGFEEPWFMDFHHRNPEDKSYEVKNKVMHGHFSRMQPELDKCDLLCGKCHRKIHARSDLYTKHKDAILDRLNELRSTKGVFKKKPRSFTPQEVEELKKLVDQGYFMKEIADLMKRDYDAIKAKIRSLKLSYTRQTIRLDENKLIKMFQDGNSMEAIGREFNVNSKTIKKRLITNGLI